MRQKPKTPIHGADHLPGGHDPIPFGLGTFYEDPRLLADPADSVVFDSFPSDKNALELEWSIAAYSGGDQWICALFNDDTFGSADSYAWNLAVPHQLLGQGSTDGETITGGHQAAVIGLCSEDIGGYNASVGSIRLPNYARVGPPSVYYSGGGSWSRDSARCDPYWVGGFWGDTGPITKVTLILFQPGDDGGWTGDTNPIQATSLITLRVF